VARKSGTNLIEIFSAIQGEGPGVGQRQLLVRIAGCNRDCRYCDTDYKTPRSCRVERRAGKRDWQQLANPVGSEAVLDAIERLAKNVRHTAVAWTGGEPLLADRFLKSVLPPLRAIGLRQELHTNCTLPDKLSQLINLFDGISADIKLPNATGEHLDWEVTARFLRLARGKLLALKMVVVHGLPEAEFDRALDVANSAGQNVPLVLQPVTAVAAGAEPPQAEELLAMQARALRVFDKVLVIPQTHKMIGQL